MLLSQDERALMTEENDDDDIEASAADPKPPFNPMDLGIRPSPFSRRNLPWCLFDYIAIPAALFFGVAPLIYAQVCQIWTDRLVYRVSGKPQVSPASMSKDMPAVGLAQRRLRSKLHQDCAEPFAYPCGTSVSDSVLDESAPSGARKGCGEAEAGESPSSEAPPGWLTRHAAR